MSLWELKQKCPAQPGIKFISGEGGIRTLDTLLRYTHFPGVLFRPLRHLSEKERKGNTIRCLANKKAKPGLAGFAYNYIKTKFTRQLDSVIKQKV